MIEKNIPFIGERSALITSREVRFAWALRVLLCTRLQKKKLLQSSVWEITRFTMNRLRNSQTMSDEENNDRKFSSLVREGGELPMLVWTKCSTLGSRPLSPFPYRIQQGINFSWKLKIPTLEVVTKNGLGKRVARLPGCKWPFLCCLSRERNNFWCWNTRVDLPFLGKESCLRLNFHPHNYLNKKDITSYFTLMTVTLLCACKWAFLVSLLRENSLVLSNYVVEARKTKVYSMKCCSLSIIDRL